jgi:protein-arginine kinase activator protein McsA
MELTVSRINMKCSFCHVNEATKRLRINDENPKEYHEVCDDCYNETIKLRMMQLKEIMKKRSAMGKKVWETRKQTKT